MGAESWPRAREGTECFWVVLCVGYGEVGVWPRGLDMGENKFSSAAGKTGRAGRPEKANPLLLLLLPEGLAAAAYVAVRGSICKPFSRFLGEE